jgi:hypothetical protein
MSKESIPTAFPAGDFISENAVRGVFGRRRRRTPPTSATEPVHVVPANPPTTGENLPPAVGGRPPLRRWSVAELIARAVPAPPADGISRC